MPTNPSDYYQRKVSDRRFIDTPRTSSTGETPRRNYRRIWAISIAMGVLAVATGFLTYKAVDTGEIIGTEEEAQFAEDVVAGKNIEVYPHMLIFHAEPETHDEPIRVRTTPATNTYMERGSPTNNIHGQLLTSAKIKFPLYYKGHIPVQAALYPEEVTPGAIQDYLRWISDDAIRETREDGSPYVTMLCLEGVDPWFPLSARLDPERGNIELGNGVDVSFMVGGSEEDLLESAHEAGYSEAYC